MRQITLIFLLLLLVACAGQTAVEPATQPALTAAPPITVAATEVIEPTAVPTNPPAPTNEPAPVEPPPLPPAEPAPTEAVAAAEEPGVVVEYGRTEEGAFFKGAADAPVTLIDYSDFL